ncbi:MAG: hypothetical protein CME36_04965 [unclassified Hahellaceae]|nr:hypothetical protein [Hahellaceae bacterium]|tara:strand:+ start:15104 stop:15310 length:207 start_codon:yes stop_codon:yes gene_type:complete
MQQKPDAITTVLFIFVISLAVSGFTTMMHDDAEAATASRSDVVKAVQLQPLLAEGLTNGLTDIVDQTQ